jgi:hemerythrin-like metal-binding protein
MEFFTWKDSFNTHIPEIDRQHQHIFAVLNRLYEAAQTPVDLESVKTLLLEVNAYAHTHFSTEEKLMARYNYPELPMQKTQHNYYKMQIAQLTREFEDENVAVVKRILQFLKDWFLGHILQEDLKFAEVIRRETGTTPPR